MAKLGTLTLKGASGTKYEFDVHSADANWKDGIACVYYVSRRTVSQDGTGSHDRIYVGETDNLKERHSSHHRQKCFEQNGYNCISIFRASNAEARRRIERDLIDSLDPPCNRE